MCLHTVKRTSFPKGRKITAFKALLVTGVGLRSIYYDSGSPMPIGRWLKAEGESIRASDGSSYRAGFHAFRRKKDAKAWGQDRSSWNTTGKVKKVTLRKLTASGTDLYDCFVAKEMKIL